MKAYAFFLAATLSLHGCYAEPPRRPPPAVAPVAPVQPLASPVEADPAPAPPVNLRWVDGVALTAPVGVSIRLVPTPTHEDESARVMWTATAPLVGNLVGIDLAGNVVAIDWRSVGRTGGGFDVLRHELEAVARWEVAQLK